MSVTLIGKKLGSMRLFDGDGRARGVSVIEVAPNRVTQLRSPERDGYSAVQVAASGPKKRLSRPRRGHLRAAGLENEALDVLREFRVDSADDYELGQEITLEIFAPGQFVDVQGTSKGRGFAGGVRRWNFRGGPKTHGQSDRHRAPGSIGAGTTPGRVFKGQKMAGHMGARTVSVLNLLVVQVDPAHNLLFVEGSVPGPRGGLVAVQAGRRPALAEFNPPELPVLEDDDEDAVSAPAVVESESANAEDAGDEAPADGADAEAAPEASTDGDAEPGASEAEQDAAGEEPEAAPDAEADQPTEGDEAEQPEDAEAGDADAEDETETPS